MRKISMIAVSAAAFLTAACGGSPVPGGMFLTLSVSTRDVAVETRVNGAVEKFVSGASGSLVSSAPINARVKEGENTVAFSLSPVASDDGATPDPGFLATLEISLKGEIVDTTSPGDRVIFTRELTDAESAQIANGESIVITETFSLERAKLQAMKEDAKD